MSYRHGAKWGVMTAFVNSLIQLVQGLERKAAEPAGQNAGGDADQEREHGADAQQHRAEPALAEALPKADAAEYAAQECACAGAHDNSAHDERCALEHKRFKLYQK